MKLILKIHLSHHFRLCSEAKMWWNM